MGAGQILGIHAEGSKVNRIFLDERGESKRKESEMTMHILV